MKVYFIDSVDGIEEKILSIDAGSLLIMGYGLSASIDLVSELDNRSDIMRRLSDFARRRDLTIILGIRARIYRREYLSAVCVDKGKIFGISDVTHRVYLDEKFNLGASFRVYSTSLGNVGIVLHGDVLYPEVIRAVSKGKTDFLVELTGRIYENRVKDVISVLSQLNGIMAFCIVNNDAFIVNYNGEILLDESSEFASQNVDVNRDYTLIKHLRNSIYDDVFIEE